jgi:outer membrane beta-barrel protein
VYAGELFGAALTADPVAGALPRLADHLTYGARYDHSFGPVWGLELSAQQTRTRTAPVAQAGVSDVRLRAAELDVTWNFTQGGPVVGYTLMGAGYARARLDPALAGNFDGVPTPIHGRVAATANLGIGARAYATRHLSFRGEVRYRFMEHLVAPGGRALNTLETTAGLGWRF